MLTEAQVRARYGEPGDAKQQTILQLPYPMRVAWDKSHTVDHIQCHWLIAQDLKAVFQEILDVYGLPKIQELGIDLFGGCLNVRPMRGTENNHPPTWSRHAWGIAIDLDPDRNGLKTSWKKAQFSKPEYTKMVDIFYKHGFMSYGKDRGFDPMHWEINK